MPAAPVSAPLDTLPSAESVQVSFSPEGLLVLNLCLAFMLFGVALDLRRADFQQLALNPRGILLGVVSQVVLLPALTFLLVWLWRPAPGLALGMALVAACPGGNVSNYLVHLARGNTALSVSLTTLVTLGAVLLTPLNFTFWAGLLPETAEQLRVIELSFWDMLQTVALLILLPLLLGLAFARRFPRLRNRWRRPVGRLSLVLFAGFVVAAFASNWQVVVQQSHRIFGLVVLHNALALSMGYAWSRWVGRAPQADVRAISMETGIQNSALGLVLIFEFFGGYGDMALVAAMWGVWHLITGGLLARWWRRQAQAASA